MHLPLQTERLTIRPFRLSDIEALHAIYADPEVMQHVDGSYETRADTEAALETHIAMHERDGYAFWAVLHDDELIGEVGFGRMGDDIEIGWTFARTAWGRGFATEAARAALTCGPSERVIAVIRPENAGSIRVAEKLGFTLEGPRTVRGREQLVYVSKSEPALAASR